MVTMHDINQKLCDETPIYHIMSRTNILLLFALDISHHMQNDVWRHCYSYCGPDDPIVTNT